MYDYGLSTLEQYGLTAESTARTRGALLCHTQKGLVIIREFKGSEKKLQKQQELLQQIQQQGGKTDCYLENLEENLVSRDQDGIPYTVQYWYEGRECDTRSREDIFRSIRALAELHQKMHMPVIEFYIEPSLLNEYQRHNQELKKIRSFIRKRGPSCPFEKLYLATVEEYLKDGEQTACILKESAYDSLRQTAMEQGCVCHGEYNQHNVLMLKNGTAVTNFEHWGFDIQMADLYRFMRKILEKYNWDIRLGREMLRVYHQTKAISTDEWQNLKLRFCYPEKYWKLANYYYTHRKTWISAKNTEKLQNLIRQRDAWKNFQEQGLGTFPF
ncbi:phosphotransferase [Blautia sp. MSJ-19]|uniref:phosphotransferase n=1 Tax=Blautia sp. MSJ-19 TaxID=2841517 RepID=UPI001C0ED1A5|nr:phosphotransferase [Blautia sp. MSJ-19]MBU5479639.1 phosphotransferase [Blautia sp. MSJ-19]